MVAGSQSLSMFLRDTETIILDGGLGTELERQGADLSSHLWSARCPILCFSLSDAVCCLSSTIACCSVATFPQSSLNKLLQAVAGRSRADLPYTQDLFWTRSRHRHHKFLPGKPGHEDLLRKSNRFELMQNLLVRTCFRLAYLVFD